MRKGFLMSALLLSALLGGASAAWALDAIVDGSAKAVIVIPEKAKPAEQYAAQELQTFLRRASGAELPILTESAAKDSSALRYQVGMTRAARKLTGKGLPLNGFLLKSVDDGLILAGGDSGGKPEARYTATGTLYAVYQYLEDELKVLWLWPDEQYGVVVRPKKTVSFGNYDVRVMPPFTESAQRYLPKLWTRRAARTISLPPDYPDNHRGGHAFVNWYKMYWPEHKDFFAMVNGKRVNKGATSAMCVSNPEFHKEIVRRWVAAGEKEPGRKFAINACEDDTPGICSCPRCLAWDGPDKHWSFHTQKSLRFKNVGERYARFYKALYDLASKIDPNVEVHGYAYLNYIYPPVNTKLNPNIMIRLVPPAEDLPFPYHPKYKKEMFDLLRQWQKTGATLNYRPNILGGYAMPENYVRDYYEEFQLMRECRMKTIDVDGPNTSFATQGPFLYVLSRLMVHPSAKLDDLLAEYYSGFGPAAKEVRAYWAYWEKYAQDHAESFTEVPIKYNLERHRNMYGFQYAHYAHILFPQECFVPARKLLDKALSAAKDFPDDLKRVEFLKAGLEHAALCSKVCAVLKDPKATREQKLAEIEKVQAFRKSSLPEWASAVKDFNRRRRNEDLVWKLPPVREPGTYLDLKQYWLGIEDKQDQGEKLGYFKKNFDTTGWIGTDTWDFLERHHHQDYHFYWYRLKVKLPPEYRNRKTILRLGAVDESCWVWIDGKRVGQLIFNAATDPDSWQNPFDVDVTEAVKGKEEITIAVKLENVSGNGGLWKPSSLIFPKK